MMTTAGQPSGYSYWVDERVWAGEFPVWDWNTNARLQQLRLFTDFGINLFLDLTEAGEMPPYAPLLSSREGRLSFPIANGSHPTSVEAVQRVFEQVAEALRGGVERRLYIHCVGGVGRTGLMVACYYIYFKRMGADEALATMRSRFAAHGRSAWMSTPENDAQVDFVRRFASFCRRE